MKYAVSDEFVLTYVDMSLEERVTKLNSKFKGAAVKQSTLWHRMKRAGVTWRLIKWNKKIQRNPQKDEQ